MSTPVTAQYLLEGAVYSLEHCGQLLHDAILLYRNNSYATAIAIALFAREELGQWELLLDLRREVVGGAMLTIDDIRDRCKDHVVKQQRGKGALSVPADTGTTLGKLLQAKFAAVATSDNNAIKETTKQLEEMDRRLSKRTPDDRHKDRMKALYVDPISDQKWNRPVTEISRQQALEVLTAACNDYTNKRERYLWPELWKDDNPELFGALTSWVGRPADLPLLEIL